MMHTGLIILFSMAVFVFPVAAQAAENDSGGARTLSLTGTGIVKAAPDIARVRSGVVTQAKTARAALIQNSAAMQAVLDLLHKHGIDKKDMRTDNFQVRPQYYRNDKKRNQPPVITGYRVSNMLRVTVRNLNRLGVILDDIVMHGANSINSINFSVSRPKALRDEARQKAMADALRKARLYSQAAGARLGRVMTIRETGGNIPPRPRMAMSAMESKSAVPIARGTQAIRASVAVTWELE